MTTKEYKYNFCGMYTDSLTEKTKNLFKEYYDNILISKKSFRLELNSKNIDVYTCIETLDMSEYSENDNSCIVTIGIIPSFNSLSEKNKAVIISEFDDDDKEFLLQHSEQLLPDILNYGFSIPLFEETVEPSLLDYTINSAIAIHSAVEGLIGFNLDRIINKIGNTGWDFLSDYCEDVDLLKLAINRYNK